MTGCSHSYRSIKFIHCSAPQRDALSDKMVLWVVNHNFYFMLCHSFLLSTVISFVYKANGGSIKACQLSSVWKILEKEFFYFLLTLILRWIKLENFVMQFRRQSVEAWQNEKHYSKENNTSENPIPRKEIFKSVDHVKYEGQVRSGHNICHLCSFLVELSSCGVTLRKLQ